MDGTKQVAVWGGGCFWCLEAIYQDVNGVDSVAPGYGGGSQDNPTYAQVCSGTTGHAEVVRIVFDTTKIHYEDLVRLFFHVHDPTTLNRQGHDEGTQYRSIILYQDESQRVTALRVMGELEKQRLWPNPWVTQLVPLQTFWPAESYHRNYFQNNPAQGYCRLVIAPKLAQFRKEHRELLRK